MEEPTVKPGTAYLDSLGQNKRPLELTCGNATVEENSALTIIGLSASDHQLVVFLGDLKIIHGKTGNRERYPQSCRTDLLDIVWRITVG